MLRQRKGSGCFYLIHTLEVVSDLNLQEWGLYPDGLLSSFELYCTFFVPWPRGLCY